MSQFAPPVLLGLLIWWSGTGAILFLDGLPRHTFRWSMAGASVLGAAALGGLFASAGDTTITGAYCAFTCAVFIWGWLEISFYLGYLTGPRTRHCHLDCGGWRHFGHAIAASLWHEIAILVLAAAVVLLTRGAPNQFGTWTFVTLWWMHQSARLNVFLGVKNLNAEFLPEHLAHLRCFFRSAPMNMLFPFSVTLSTIAAVLLGKQALAHMVGPGSGPAAEAFRATGYTLVTTMMVLAILEHWFLVLPLPAAKAWNRLWEWGLRSRRVSGIRLRRKQSTIPGPVTMGGHP